MDRSSFPPRQDDFARALLRSADQDEPSQAAYANAASALGVGVGMGVGASLPVAAAAVGLSDTFRWSTSLFARLATVGVSGALLVGAGALWIQRHPGPSSAHSDQLAVAGAGAGRVPPARVAQGVLPAAELPSAPPVAMPALPESAPRAFPESAPRATPLHRSLAPRSETRRADTGSELESGSSLVEQVQSLDRARVALRSGDPTAALREISHYRKNWTQGVFLTEASVLEIEALAARGERSLAAARASAFVAAHPDSPQVARLRALMPATAR